MGTNREVSRNAEKRQKAEPKRQTPLGRNGRDVALHPAIAQEHPRADQSQKQDSPQYGEHDRTVTPARAADNPAGIPTI